MRVERLTRLAVDPFDIASLEDFARLTPDMVPEAARLADAAARDLENYASVALLNQSIRVRLDEWPGTEWLALPVAPYVSGAPLAVTVAGLNVTGFTVVDGLRPALRLADLPVEGEIVITYQAGFGAALAAVPPDLRHAILDQAAVGFDLRGQSDPKFGTGLSPHMARVAARYRRVAI
ncbi:MAG: hypothetical protein IOD05_07930 [Rhodobacter sp.]|nr:hypothetical protein [Rhodobacter sp.]MCA3493669.1 hypothetical protein [Rhodobacter sp.]MCA3500172.1 hypothetical protein [Rhodobacter sp.]MCA3503162.1 hypothetical protein [Rhodobacter sp.]MCA3517409.1 hypothetical protein [Rhodobacter sp.]